MNNFFNKTLSKFEETFLSYSVIIMAILLIINVFARTIFNNSLGFSEEVGQSLLVVVTFMGIPYCAKKARHITMSIVFDMLNDKYKKMLMLVVSFFSAAAMFYFTSLGYKYMLKVQMLGRVTPSLRIPVYIIYAAVPLGFLLGAIEYTRTFIINLKEKEVYISSEKTMRVDDELLVTSVNNEELSENNKDKEV